MEGQGRSRKVWIDISGEQSYLSRSATQTAGGRGAAAGHPGLARREAGGEAVEVCDQVRRSHQLSACVIIRRC